MGLAMMEAVKASWFFNFSSMAKSKNQNLLADN